MTAKEIAQGAFASLSTLLRIAAKAKSQRVSTIWFCICLMSYVEKEDFMREDVHSKEFWDEAQKKAAFQKRFDRPDCIVLDSEYCSMGRMIAVKACERGGYTYYDAEKLMSLLEPEERELVARYDKVLGDTEITEEDLKKDSDFERVSRLYQQAIGQALKDGPCLIHECGIKERIEPEGFQCVSVLFYAMDQQEKRERARTAAIYKDLETAEELDKAIEREDHRRRIYHNALSERPWGRKVAYDLCLNTDVLGRKKSAELLEALMAGEDQNHKLL